MNRQQVLAIYDDEYARTYNERFLLNERSKVPSDHEIALIGQLLPKDGGWLDVACGTGYVLSRFPSVPRAGLDLSPAMLRVARQSNPDALFFHEGDFRDEVPEWQGQWALVTCMWYSYGLVESMADVQRLVRNLASWTSGEGACFVPLCDPELLTEGLAIPYRREERSYGGAKLITGVIWTWEEAGKRHDNMIAPQVEYMVAMFQEHFTAVEVVEYSLSEPGPHRKAIVARAKKRA